MLNDQWTHLKAGGAVENRGSSGLVTRPRVMLELDARVSDPIRFALGTGGQDPDQTIDCVKQMVMKAVEAHLATRPILSSTSGAYPLADDATVLANNELSPLGIEVTITTLEVSLSPEDQEAAYAASRE